MAAAAELATQLATFDWTPILTAVVGLLVAIIAAWRAHLASQAAAVAAKAAEKTEEKVTVATTKLNGVVVELDEVKAAAEALGVEKERKRREEQDNAVHEAMVMAGKDPKK